MSNQTKLTKIVATLGPASDSKTKIEKLIRSGVDVFRFNTKHGEPRWHEERIKRVQSVADKLKKSIAILVDLQGPEIRIETKEGENIRLKKGEIVGMESSFTKSSTKIVIPHKAVFDVLKKGDNILIDDGHIEMKVVSVKGNSARLKAKKTTIIKNRKGANIPGKKIDMPSLIKSDLKQLDMAAINKVDFIALSFARNKKDVAILKKEMLKRKVNAKIVVKIENETALENIDELIAVSDAVMVARGDLGVEVPIERLAYWQKNIIKKCIDAKKPVITATEMLDSMIKRPRPTRAEATDVSNAIFNGTDAIMLSGETASGQYPIGAVKMMTKIAAFTEGVKKFEVERKPVDDKTQLIGTAAMDMLYTDGVDVNKIVVFTQTGYTARVVSAFRPNVPIIAVTESQKTVETLCLSYGVFGYKFRFPNGKLVSPDYILKKLAKKRAIRKGESVLVIHGATWRTPGLTNAITLIEY